ncbi:MAG: hypothetical protein AAGE84_22705 [Cyanobacteria bacterium P01_G01_bin.39]
MVSTHPQNLSTQTTLSNATVKSASVAYTKTKLRDVNPRTEAWAFDLHSMTSTRRV